MNNKYLLLNKIVAASIFAEGYLIISRMFWR
ncbi:Uncharacterised protein [Staphylococcus kloosii]|jgi:hypothetical protein|nr:Uncharacterised protein [Staphylococcus kloosii]